MANANDGWSVGQSGTILHWNGATWAAAQSPTTANLYAVKLISSTVGWAAGANGTLLQLSGGTWITTSSAIASDLLSLAVLSPTDAWAAGHDTIAHWTGSTWDVVTRTTGTYLTSISLDSPTDGWAVTGNPVDAQPILHWNGLAWTPQGFMAGAQAVQMLSANDGWAVGRIVLAPAARFTEIWHWGGANWTLATTTTLTGTLRAVSFATSTDGWTAGDAGLLLHWNGSEWGNLGSPTTATLNGLDMVSATDGWAVGEGGVILRYQPAYQIYFPAVGR